MLRDKSTVLEMWKELEDTFERKRVASRIFLKKRLVHMTFEASGSLAGYFKKFEAAVRELKGAGGKMDDDDIVMQLLISLPAPMTMWCPHWKI